MRRRNALIVCAIATAPLALFGCGQVKQAAEVARVAQDAQDGQFTVKGEKGETATIKTGATDNSVTITTTDAEGKTAALTGSNKVDMDKVGIEAYPGAAQEQGGTVEGPEMDIASVTLATTDAFDKVAAFYKGKYPKASSQSMAADGKQSLSLQIMDPANPNDLKMVVATQEEGRVTILLQHHLAKTPAGAQK